MLVLGFPTFRPVCRLLFAQMLIYLRFEDIGVDVAIIIIVVVIVKFIIIVKDSGSATIETKRNVEIK